MIMNLGMKPPVWVRIVTFLVSLVLFFSVVGAMFICDVRIITDKDNMSAIIRQALFSRQTVRPAAGTGGSGAAHARAAARLASMQVRLDEEKKNTSGDASGALVEWMYNTLKEQYGDQLDVSLEGVQAFVEESTLKDEIASLGASLISDFYTGENTTVLSEETLQALLEENAQLIEKHFGVTLTEKDIQDITDTVASNDYITQIQERGVAQVLISAMTGGSGGSITGGNTQSGTELAQTITSLLETFRAYTSAGALIACIAVAVVCAAVIVVLNLKWIWRALRCIGTPLLLASLPMALVSGCVLLMAGFWDGIFAGISASVGAAVTTVIRLTAPVALGAFGTGIALLIAALALRLTVGSKRKKEALTRELSDALTEEEPAPEALAVE